MQLALLLIFILATLAQPLMAQDIERPKRKSTELPQAPPVMAPPPAPNQPNNPDNSRPERNDSDRYENNDNGDEDEVEYLFCRGTSISGFGGPIFEFSNVLNESAVMIGGGGGIIFNRRFFIGGYGQGLTNNIFKTIRVDNRLRENAKVSFGHAGLWMGYSFNHRKLIHPFASVRLGAGSLTWLDEDDNEIKLSNREQNTFIVFTPSIGGEINLLRWFKICIEGGYRFVGNTDLEIIEDKAYRDLQSPFITTTFRFGGF
jgi:hypothetical protein